ncbi:MAG: hypothetical protein AAFV80_20775, partial [Bacteroidota bacterium]
MENNRHTAMKTMNKSMLLLAFATLLFACQPQEDPAALSVAQQKDLLESKKEELRNLESEISDLERLIASKDSSF